MIVNRGICFGAFLFIAICLFCKRTPAPTYHFITSEGRPAFSATFSDAHDFCEGLAAVAQDDQWGFIDHAGTPVIAFQFAYADSFHDGFATVTGADQRMAVINRDGRVVFPFTRNTLINLGLGWFAVHDLDSNSLALHDSSGVEKHPPCFARIEPFREGYAAFTTTDESGFLDEHGAGAKIVSPGQSGDSGIGLWQPMAFHEGLCAFWIRQDNPADWSEFDPPAPCGYLDHNGNRAVAANYLECGPFSQGLAAVRDQSSWRLGYLRPNQSWLIEPVFDAGGTFSEGLVWVEHGQRLHYRNLAGNRAFAADFETDPDRFDTAYRSFSEGLAGAKQGGLYGYINHEGEWIIPPRFSEVRPFHEGLARVRTTD